MVLLDLHMLLHLKLSLVLELCG